MINDLTPGHKEALLWFATRAGEMGGWPGQLPGGQFLATRAKGIYSPAGSKYALSIKVIPGSPYPDSDPEIQKDGRWSFNYHQEERNGRNADTFKTNIGLRRCLEDGVPVGVIRRIKPKPNVVYEILGLAAIVEWSDGFFRVEGPVSVDFNENIDSLAFNPLTAVDARLWVMTSITRRQGQPAFRAALLRAYEQRCAVSGCDIVEVLEAAHIAPYRGAETNVTENGLLLRADLHTLFDLGLMHIDPVSFTVRLAKPLINSAYGEFESKRIFTPLSIADRPSPLALSHRMLTNRTRSVTGGR